MITEKSLKLLQSTAQQAVKVYAIPEISDERTTHVWNGTMIESFAASPPIRKHAVHTLTDLLEYAVADPVVGEEKNPVIWHGSESVVAILNDADRRDKVTFSLTYSDKFQTLQKLAENEPFFDQPGFIRLLRFKLGLDNASVVSQFRRLQWNNGNTTDAIVNRGDLRMGKDIIARVENVDQLPEELSVPTPVYSQMGESTEYVVRCGVEIDSVNHRFQLIPLPDELERVVDLAQTSIRERLVNMLGLHKSDIPVYYGEA